MQFRIRYFACFILFSLLLILSFYPRGQTPMRWNPVSGAWMMENGSISQREVGDILYTKSRRINEDQLSSQTLTNYDIKVQVRRSEIFDGKEYAAIYFRSSSEDMGNSYALTISQSGALELYVRQSGALVSLLRRVSIPIDVKYHRIEISAVDSLINIWFDRAQDELPDISITDSTYPNGGIAFKSTSKDTFRELVVENRMNVVVSPSHLYPDTTARIHISSSIPFASSLSLSLINPLGKVSKINNPTQCLYAFGCELTLPQDFPLANIAVYGTYTLVINTNDEITKTLLEVKEKPLTSFLQLSDIHNDISELENTVKKINANTLIPHPDFAVITGDLTNFGTREELAAVKKSLDKLTLAYYPTTGNHDVLSDKGSDAGHAWSDIFGSDRFSYYWTTGSILYAALDVDAPYGGYGTSPGSNEHMFWLKSLMTQNPSRYLFLFDHYGFSPVRDNGGAKTYWDSPKSASTVRSLIEEDKNAVLNFSGHSHISGLSKIDNVFYIQSPAFVHIGEYRLVEVYKDRIESLLLKKRDHVKKDDYQDDEQSWSFEKDSTHNPNTYSYGLPHERQFIIHLPSKTNDVLSGIITAEDTPSLEDYQLSTDITLHKEDMYGENSAGIVVRYTDPNNYYEVTLDSGSKTASLKKRVKGAFLPIKTVPVPIKVNAAYHLVTEVRNDLIEVFLDEKRIITVRDNSFRKGGVGLKSYLAPAYYRNTSLKAFKCLLYICL